MGMRQFLKDAVSAQQAEFAADGGGTAARFCFGCRGGGQEERLQVAIPECVDGELAAIDGPQQGQVASLERVQGAYRAALPAHTLFDRSRQFPQRRGIVHPG